MSDKQFNKLVKIYIRKDFGGIKSTQKYLGDNREYFEQLSKDDEGLCFMIIATCLAGMYEENKANLN